MDATQLVRETLNCVINDLKYVLNKRTLRLLDVPCGDMRWMSLFLRKRSDIEYTGMVIVPEIIEHHKRTYINETWSFEVHDIVAEPLLASYDLIFSRDMTQHLTSGDTLRVLHHFSVSDSYFVMMTSYPAANNDKELAYIKERFLRQNLERSPYALTPPVCVRPEKSPREGEYSALWRLPLKQQKSG